MPTEPWQGTGRRSGKPSHLDANFRGTESPFQYIGKATINDRVTTGTQRVRTGG